MATVLGFFNRPWSSLPLVEALDSIVNTGTNYVGFLGSSKGILLEWNTPWEEVENMRTLLGQRDMELRAVLAHVHFDVPEEEAITRYKALIDRATALNAGTLLEMGAHEAAQVDMYFRVMKVVCGYAQDHGLNIVIKPHGGITSTGQECAQVVERVGHDNYRLWWDPGNIIYYRQLDPVAEALHVRGMVTGVCVKDCLIRPDGTPTVDVTPGEGQVDFESVFRTLVDGGFKGGPCLIETLGPSDPQAATEAGKVALQYITRVMNGAGL
jgi:sugar phosphate isomerase/epimerase